MPHPAEGRRRQSHFGHFSKLCLNQRNSDNFPRPQCTQPRLVLENQCHRSHRRGPRVGRGTEVPSSSPSGLGATVRVAAGRGACRRQPLPLSNAAPTPHARCSHVSPAMSPCPHRSGHSRENRTAHTGPARCPGPVSPTARSYLNVLRSPTGRPGSNPVGLERHSEYC